jgi:ribA/ribD-fused uncharacterized protein
MTKTIMFYIREDPYGFLSNFWRARQCVNGYIYPTNEHYYQSMKAISPAMCDWIRKAPTARAAMNAGRHLKHDEIKNNWENEKTNIMLDGIRAKFSGKYNFKLRQDLLDTGNALLIENSPTDMFWGGAIPNSKNMLGILLMRVRSEQQLLEV